MVTIRATVLGSTSPDAATGAALAAEVFSLKLLLPLSFCGLLIGQKGFTIQSLAKETRTRIQLSQQVRRVDKGGGCCRKLDGSVMVYTVVLAIYHYATGTIGDQRDACFVAGTSNKTLYEQPKRATRGPNALRADRNALFANKTSCSLVHTDLYVLDQWCVCVWQLTLHTPHQEGKPNPSRQQPSQGMVVATAERIVMVSGTATGILEAAAAILRMMFFSGYNTYSNMTTK